MWRMAIPECPDKYKKNNLFRRTACTLSGTTTSSAWNSMLYPGCEADERNHKGRVRPRGERRKPAPARSGRADSAVQSARCARASWRCPSARPQAAAAHLRAAPAAAALQTAPAAAPGPPAPPRPHAAVFPVHLDQAVIALESTCARILRSR